MLRPYLDAAGFDWYLRKIISTNELASTWFHDIIEENFADGVVAGAWFTIVKNSEEGCVKLIIENRITCLPDRAAEAGSVSYNLKAGDIELGIVLRVKRWIVKYRRSLNCAIGQSPGTKGELSPDRPTLSIL
jgi:hypothetical protein